MKPEERSRETEHGPLDWPSLNARLEAVLKTIAPPVAISFRTEGQDVPAARLPDEAPEPNDDGRTGQVPAGCVFWIRGAEETFATAAPGPTVEQDFGEVSS